METDRAAKGDDEALTYSPSIEEQHQLVALVTKIVSRYYKGQDARFDDLVVEGLGGLAKAVRTFNDQRGVKLKTWATWQIDGRIRDYLRREARRGRMSSIDEHEEAFGPIADPDEPRRYEDPFEAERFLHILTTRQRVIFQLHYLQGLSLAQTSRKLGCSKQAVSQSHALGLARLRDRYRHRKEDF